MEKIDKLDRQILNIISKNARIPFKDVAEECGVSRAAIHQRVQRMIDMNVIVGSGYHINPKILGYNTCTYIGVKLERGSMYKDVVPEFEKIPEVVECHFTTGPYSLINIVYGPVVKWHSTTSGIFSNSGTTSLYIEPRSNFTPI